jgi:hypothetical protein
MGQQSDVSKAEFPLTALAQREAVGMEYLLPSEYRKSWPIGKKYTTAREEEQGMSQSPKPIKTS